MSEKTYRLKMAKKEHKDHVRDLLATAIVHKALDMEVSFDCMHLPPWNNKYLYVFRGWVAFLTT